MNSNLTKKRSMISAARGIAHYFSIHFLRNKFIEVKITSLDLIFKVKSNTIFSWKLSKYRSYEPENSNFIIQSFPFESGGLLVDVGANFGWYACIFAKIAGKNGTVVCFEPDNENLDLLKYNLNNNSLYKNTNVIEAGVGELAGKLALRRAPDSNPGMHSIVNLPHTNNNENFPQIVIVTLDEALEKYPGSIDLLKIDIEGYEINALMGAQKTLARCKNLLIEYSPGFLKTAGKDPFELIKIIDAAGFSIFKLENGKKEAMSIEFLKNLDKEVSSLFFFQIDLFCIKNKMSD
jgi:FkbM family methyltransferase